MNNNTQAATATMAEYCMLVTNGKFLSSKVSIHIKFGEETANLYNPAIREQTLKAADYEQLIDALNYMATLGWEVLQVIPYLHHDGGSSREFEYLMKRTVRTASV